MRYALSERNGANMRFSGPVRNDDNMDYTIMRGAPVRVLIAPDGRAITGPGSLCYN